MDMVRRAYFLARRELPAAATFEEVEKYMKLSMVRWIKLRVYSRHDWPARELGEYPKEQEAEVK